MTLSKVLFLIILHLIIFTLFSMDAEKTQWRKQYEQIMSDIKCPACGSNHITKTLRGKPYMKYVEYHKELSKELGWPTLKLSGCTKSSNPHCAECKTPVAL